MITEADLEEAMLFLAESDEDYAESKAALESSEIVRKRVRARVFLLSDGTVAERTAKAEVHLDTQGADDKYISSLEAHERLKAKRQRADMRCDIWRTISANQRKS